MHRGWCGAPRKIDTALGLLARRDKCTQKANAHFEEMFESELDLCEVAAAVLGEFDGSIGSVQSALDVADESFDGSQETGTAAAVVMLRLLKNGPFLDGVATEAPRAF